MAHIITPGFDHVDDSECEDPSYVSYTYASTNVTSSDEDTLISTAKSVEDHAEVPTFPAPPPAPAAAEAKVECAEIKKSSDIDVIGSLKQSSMQREKSPDCYSIFPDTECGEPLSSQHLRIDFTTIPGVDDTEFLRRKCADFWKLVEGSKKLLELKVLPEKPKEAEVIPEVEKSSSQSLVTEQGDHVLANHGAIHIIERKGRMVDECFMNRMRPLYCESGSGDYFTHSPQKPGAIQHWHTPRRGSRLRLRAREEVANMCSELEQWDLNHPKSMEPPNHGPPHTYAVLQRN